MSDSIIKVSNVSKVYRLYDKPIDRMKEALNISKKKFGKDYYALHNISFEIKRGETIGIVGTNGSGKSTILKIITGILSQTSGEVIVKGRISALLELGAGFNPEYTGMENIYLNGTMMGYSREEIQERIRAILDFADIGDFIYQPVKTYSSGMFARLAFAVAINVEPEILIVDEALSVGDTRFQMKCMEKMNEMMQGGTTVIFVSHDINAIKRFCTRAIWINKGVLMADGEVNYVTDRYIDFSKKLENNHEEVTQQINEINKEEILPFVSKEGIAEIVSFKVLSNNKEVEEISLNEPIKIEVIYDVYDEKIDDPVLGIAILGIDGEYICGLNTLLDKIDIPWEYGRNRILLEYTQGIRVLGGTYYFNVALKDKTATVDIYCKAMIKTFTVVNEYIGEGKLIIPHRWTI